MAGIGFVLRKLSKQDNLFGVLQAYSHSALASTGPWIFTVIALGLMVSVGRNFVLEEEVVTFKLVVIYNFAFSLAFSGSVFMIATRYLADSLYKKDVTDAVGLLFGAFILLFFIQLPMVSLFYLGYAKFSPVMALSAISNFMLITSIWLVSVFLTALKDYKAVTGAFIFGLIISVVAAIILSNFYGVVGLINGFTIGLAYIVSSLVARVFAEYSYNIKSPFAFLSYFKRYWEIALGGLVYNIAIWIDKWIMWFAPEAEKTVNLLMIYPNYDTAMFLAFLSIVPSMAFFVFSVETNFYEHYLKFYRDIQNKATFSRIQENHQAIMTSIFQSASNFLILQGAITIAIILSAHKIFEFLGINYLQIGMFRFGVLGALFHVLSLFLTIILSYFDNRRAAVKIQILFLVTNGLFTYISMQMGFEYYGYGYFLSSLVVFLYSAFTVEKYVSNLPYHAFVTSNTSILKR